MMNLVFAQGGGAAAPAGGNFLQMLLPLALIFLVFYFLLIRPQQKKAKQHQEFLKNLKRGDRVITSGGIYGEVVGMTDKVVTLEVAEEVRIKIARGQIAGLTQGE